MTFNAEINAQLQRKLDPSHVKQREGGSGVKLDYLEAWYVIQEANRIFGFDGWDRKTVRLEQIGDVHETKDKYGKIRYKVGYRATVSVRVGGIVREGSGFGNGIGPDLVDVHELALKEAESDAMKRAFATFGNPFGLALYDKTRAGVMTEKEEKEDGADRWTKEFLKTVNTSISYDHLMELYNSNEKHLSRLRKAYSHLAEKVDDAVQQRQDFHNATSQS